jgi:hypothetical protein
VGTGQAWHALIWQTVPVVHALPQAPQLALSVCVLTHTPPQSVMPGPQSPQTPAEHCWPIGHAWPHMPQLLLSVCVLVQTPPQPIVGGGQGWHLAIWQMNI